MRLLALVVISAGVAGCSFGGDPRTVQERTMLACTAWSEVFKGAVSRRTIGIASKKEIAAINAARPVLVPICTADLAATTGDQLVQVETLLTQILISRQENN